MLKYGAISTEKLIWEKINATQAPHRTITPPPTSITREPVLGRQRQGGKKKRMSHQL
jgi:hypothetical protein